MNRLPRRVLLCVFLLSIFAFAQPDKIAFSAGTPEDDALQTIADETDAQKKLAFYENFVQQFSSNPAAVAYGNWQISQLCQSTGDLEKALSYGDKALLARPREFDILVSQATIASQMQDKTKIVDYAARGGAVYNSELKATKPEGLSKEEFNERMDEWKQANKSSYELLETAAFNAIVDEKEAKARMSFIESFTPAFPSSRFEESVAQYARFATSQLKDSARLLAYGEKSLAANPSSMAILLLLANAYVDDAQPDSVDRAITDARKVIDVAKADAADADKSRKVSAGVAHSILGYAYSKQNKNADAVPELTAATNLLRGQDEVAYATALYRLGWAYAKMNQISDAKVALGEAVQIPGPMQAPSRELLGRINAARTKVK